MPLKPHWRRPTSIAAAAVLILLIGALTLPWSLGPHIKHRLMDAVGERFGSDVEVESIAISMLPRPRVRGRGLVLRHKHRTDVPPLITISSFSAEASLLGLLWHPLHLSRVDLEGLEINVPPGGMHVGKGNDKDDDSPTNRSDASPILIADVVSQHAVLRILRREPGKASSRVPDLSPRHEECRRR